MTDQLELPDDLEDIAFSIPFPADFLGLRAQLGLLPPQLMPRFSDTTNALLPEDPVQAASEASPLLGAAPGSVTGAAITPRSLPGTSITPGTIEGTALASTIRAIGIVSSNPALPDAAYPVDSWIYNTTDKKLYKNVADVWTYVINAGDISANELAANSVIAGKIAAAAVSTTELAAGAVTADKIKVGAITAEKLTVGVTTEAGNLVLNGSFEYGDSSILGTYATLTTAEAAEKMRGWLLIANTDVNWSTSANTKSGSRIGLFRADSTEGNRRLYQDIPVLGGRTYRLTGWHWKGATGGVTNRLRVNTLDATKTVVNFDVMFNDTTATAPVFADKAYTVPTDGTVSFLRVECLCNGTPAGGDEVFAFEDISLTEVANRLVNTAQNVTINETGITIADANSEVGLTADGFGPAWEDFIHLGVYNGTFAQSDATADTSDYWTKLNGTVAWDVVTKSAAPGGFAWRYVRSGGTTPSGSHIQSTYTPVTGRFYYEAFSIVLITAISGTLLVRQEVFWYDKSKSFISSTQINQNYTAVQNVQVRTGLLTPPTNAHYAQVRVLLSLTAGTSVTADIEGVNLRFVGTPDYFIPPGIILMWSGETTTIPVGWFLCDGTNGTPDLRDRFIVGADSTNENTSGGSVSPTAALTHATDGSGTSGAAVFSGALLRQSGTVSQITHTHSTPSHQHAAHSTMKFYRLAYIMKG